VLQGWHGTDTRNDVKATYAADVIFIHPAAIVIQIPTGADRQRPGVPGTVWATRLKSSRGPIQLFFVLIHRV
jgi:hypothetical protein